MDDEMTTKSEKKYPTKIIATASFLITLVLVACGWVLYDTTTNTHVPTSQEKITQMTDDPCGLFTKAHLRCKKVLTTNETVPRGTLISQSISAGEKVKKDSEVVVTYSRGPATLTLSELRNETVENAKKSVEKYGIKIIEEKLVADSGLKEGRIVSSTPQSGETVTNEGEIKIVVSNGKVTVPDWKGKSREIVEAEAKNKDITIVFENEESDGPSGVVLSQSGSGLIEMNQTVTIKVSKAREVKEIEVPKVIDKTPLEAQVALATAGFTHINLVTTEKEGVTADKVIAVNPGEATKAKSDTIIILTVETPKK